MCICPLSFVPFFRSQPSTLFVLFCFFVASCRLPVYVVFDICCLSPPCFLSFSVFVCLLCPDASVCSVIRDQIFSHSDFDSCYQLLQNYPETVDIYSVIETALKIQKKDHTLISQLHSRPGALQSIYLSEDADAKNNLSPSSAVTESNPTNKDNISSLLLSSSPFASGVAVSVATGKKSLAVKGGKPARSPGLPSSSPAPSSPSSASSSSSSRPLRSASSSRLLGSSASPHPLASSLSFSIQDGLLSTLLLPVPHRPPPSLGMN